MKTTPELILQLQRFGTENFFQQGGFSPLFFWSFLFSLKTPLVPLIMGEVFFPLSPLGGKG